jgi:DMSO/TMAO reductase YedYZ molybdopterin-dependent catalytic subunit
MGGVAAAGVRGGRLLAGLVGVLAGALAVGVAELAAAFVRPESSPVLAVGAVLVDSAPRPVKEFAIRTFGSADKAVLLTGIAVLLAAGAAVIGMLAARRLGHGLAGVCAFGTVGVAAVLSRPAPSPLDVLPAVLGAAAGCLALRRLVALLPAPAGRPDAGGGPGDQLRAEREVDGRGPAAAGWLGAGWWDRRRFLVSGSATAAGALLAGAGGRWLSDARFSARRSRDAVTLPAAGFPAPPVRPTADTGVAGASSFLTPNRDFYRVDTALTSPQVPADTWSLRVHGMVRREVTLSYRDLLSRPLVERVITLTCVSNEVGGPYLGTARWLGVPVRDLLAEAGLDPSVDQLVCRSADGMTIGAPARVVTDGRDALLAVGMNGEPLPIEHGFPVRMVVPGLYGYCSACKWLVDIEATTFGRYDAYWVQQGWARVAAIRTGSRIDTPRASATVPAGPVAVAGVAWAQHRGISAVEVAVDGGAWAPARLADQPTVDAWRLWTYLWDASPGPHLLAVRATDGTGAVQAAEQVEPFPSGATGYHSIQVTAR